MTIHKIVPSGMAGQGNFSETLSATGCTTADATQAALGLIPTTSTFLRGRRRLRCPQLALPDGAQIWVGDDGDFASSPSAPC